MFVPTKLRLNKWLLLRFLEIEKTSAERPFKIDFSRGHNNLKILLVEIGGRNKTTPSFIYVAYQPSSNEIEKLE